MRLESITKISIYIAYTAKTPQTCCNLSTSLSIWPRAETKALIGGGGGCIFIYSRSAQRISFEINCNDNWFQKKFVGQNANIWIYTPPPINALVSALIWSSYDKPVKIRLFAICHLQTCYNLLKQLAANFLITSFDKQLATSLLKTCNWRVVNKLSHAMQTHPDIGLL